jgi:hypothetical protein
MAFLTVHGISDSEWHFRHFMAFITFYGINDLMTFHEENGISLHLMIWHFIAFCGTIFQGFSVTG